MSISRPVFETCHDKLFCPPHYINLCISRSTSDSASFQYNMLKSLCPICVGSLRILKQNHGFNTVLLKGL